MNCQKCGADQSVFRLQVVPTGRDNPCGQCQLSFPKYTVFIREECVCGKYKKFVKVTPEIISEANSLQPTFTGPQQLTINDVKND